MDKFIETYGERPAGNGGLPTMTTRAQDTWDALRAAYEIGRSEVCTTAQVGSSAPASYADAVDDWKSNDGHEFADKEAAWKFFYRAGMNAPEELDPHIDGVVPQPVTYEEEFFLSGMLVGNLRRIYAAHDDEGNDLSNLPAKAANEIERLHVRVVNMNEALQRVKGRVCGDKHPYWSDSQRIFVSRVFIADVCDMELLTPSKT